MPKRGFKVVGGAGEIPFVGGFSEFLDPSFPSWLLEFKRRAIEEYTRIYPSAEISRRVREFISTGGFAPVVREKAAPPPEALLSYRLLDVEAYTIVMVNGVYMHDMSSEEDLPFSVYTDGAFNAIVDDPNEVRRSICSTPDAFSLLNDAYFVDGVIINVAAGERLEKPIHVISMAIPGKERMFLNPRMSLKLGKDSSAAVISSTLSLDGSGPYFENAFVRVRVSEGADFRYYKYFDLSSSSCVVENVRQHVEAGGSSRMYGYIRKAGILGGEVSTTLKSGAKALLNASADLSGAMELSLIAAAHCAGSDSSFESELYAVAGDSANVDFGTLLSTERDLSGVSARQVSKALLASPGASARLRPLQSISSEGVKAFHGAAASGIDGEAEFFLKSRGIGGEEAKALISKAMLYGGFAKIPDKAVRGELARMIWEDFA